MRRSALCNLGLVIASAAFLCAEFAPVNADPLNAASLADLKQLYKKLIDAENAHDIAAVRAIRLGFTVGTFCRKDIGPISRKLGWILGEGYRRRSSLGALSRHISYGARLST